MTFLSVRNCDFSIRERHDELMGELAIELKGEDLYATGRAPAASLQPPQAFDEQTVPGVSLSDVDQDLTLYRRWSNIAKRSAARLSRWTRYPPC